MGDDGWLIDRIVVRRKDSDETHNVPVHTYIEGGEEHRFLVRDTALPQSVPERAGK